MQVALFKIGYFERGPKKLRNISLIFSYKTSPILWTRLWKSKRIWNKLPVSLLSQSIFRKILFPVIFHQGNFDKSIQRGFWVIPKITFINLCRSVHDIIIIQDSSDPLDLECVESEEKNLREIRISCERKELFRWNKKHFSLIFEMHFFGKNRKIAHTSFKDLKYTWKIIKNDTFK